MWINWLWNSICFPTAVDDRTNDYTKSYYHIITQPLLHVILIITLNINVIFITLINNVIKYYIWYYKYYNIYNTSIVTCNHIITQPAGFNSRSSCCNL